MKEIGNKNLLKAQIVVLEGMQSHGYNIVECSECSEPVLVQTILDVAICPFCEKVIEHEECTDIYHKGMLNPPKQKYMLKDNAIHVFGSHDITIDESIFNEEKFGYRIVDREDLIDDLYRWIGETLSPNYSGNPANEQMMKDDLQLLLSVKDDYIFSSVSTNEYIYQGCADFDKTCEDLIELNNSLGSDE